MRKNDTFTRPKQGFKFGANFRFDEKNIMGAKGTFIIEVKELKHGYRLSHASYSPDKVARVQKRVLAGSEAVVILYHSEDKEWRLVPFAVFTERAGGSWDLREYESMPHKVVMLALREFMGVAK